MWSLSCDANIADEAGSLLCEWLNVYKKLGAAVVKNRHMTQCVAKKCRVS